MPFRRATIHHKTARRPSHPAPTFYLCLLLALTTSALHAQTPQPPPNTPSDDHPYTLHVYTRLVQVPTLVLSLDRKPLPPLDAQKFKVSIDSGPRFHPTHIRREGDDPITLALLLDVSGDESELLPAFSRNFTAWVSASLQPQDTVTIYAVDCSLIKTSDNAPPNPSTLLKGLDQALASPRIHGNKGRPACSSSLALRDAIALVMQSLSKLPGRRVLLAVSDGHDSGSTITPNLLHTIATQDAVTLFGLYTADLVHPRDDNIFEALAENSGGLSLQTTPNTVLNTLDYFVGLLRNRYVLEFPIPVNATNGSHEISVTIDHTNAFITASGTIFALPDPSTEQDPSTIHNDNPDAPIIGKHKPTPNP